MNKYVKNFGKNIYNRIVNIRLQRDYIDLQELLQQEDFKSITNIRPCAIHSILFVVPGIVKHMGGHTSILHVALGLSKAGFKIGLVAYSDQSIQEMKDNAMINLPGCEKIFFEQTMMQTLEYDVIVATSWRSVYYAKRIPGYKMYFIQDYEPYFFAYGDYFFLAKKTYELGFHMVSLGEWNKKEILKNAPKLLKQKIDVVDFPYERTEYLSKHRDYSKYIEKKTLRIAAYIKRDEKRLPIIAQVMLSHIKKKFAEIGITIEILYFGLEKSIPVIDGSNLGKLTKHELYDLYTRCDFGFVASMTNISLIPYEMIATGLPIIEMGDGSFSSFFGTDCAILCDFNADRLFQSIKELCMNPEKISTMQRKAEDYIRQFSWEDTCKQFVDIVKSIVIDTVI